jgi:hypothetical protein
MSKENSQIKLIDSNDEEKFDSKYKPWSYNNSTTNINLNQNRNCCSPADEIEELVNFMQIYFYTYSINICKHSNINKTGKRR